MTTEKKCVEILKFNGNQGVKERIKEWIPSGNYKHVLIKPNWVMHQSNELFPAAALVTSSELIECVVDACLEALPGVEQIMIGDVPLQTCEWNRLCAQAGIDRLVEKYKSDTRIIILDLRKQRFRIHNGVWEEETQGIYGDPLGYREVVLDDSSFLEGISDRCGGFAVQDYPKNITRSHHSKGNHSYFVCASVLDADLVINMPKMKTHQKAGITGSLKNLVGMNGDKAYLVHHTEGRRGDEFSPNASLLIKFQTRMRERVDKSSIWFGLIRKLWVFLKKRGGIETDVSLDTAADKAYIGSGSWHGNDTIWRMIYDLNKIIRYAPPDGGQLSEVPQRDYLTITDGIIAGEGNGPLQPIPVCGGVVIVAADPFAADFTMARLMGFDWRKIKCLANYGQFADPDWVPANPDEIEVFYNDRHIRLSQLDPIKAFVPPPGWRNHIETETHATR